MSVQPATVASRDLKVGCRGQLVCPCSLHRLTSSRRHPTRQTTEVRTVATFIAVVAAAMIAGCGPVGEPAAPSAEAPGTPDGPARRIATASGPVMVLIPAGEFLMGSEAEPDSRPVHRVSVSAFYMDKHEVTQEVYERLMGSNPARHKGPQDPVERVRWTDALRFCNARSQAEGLTPCYDLKTRKCDFAADGYRLPTEAEWEYACRAGTAGDYGFEEGAAGLAEHAWFKDNARRRHQPVGQKSANAFGLCDMLGNVREWCNDWYGRDYYAASPAADPHGPEQGEKTVLRGGAFSCTAESCTAWARYCDEPGLTDACVASDDSGFRCVRRAK